MSLSILFIVDGGLDRPLLHSQGLPLLRRIAERGVRCFILSFESAPPGIQSALGRELTERGIGWEAVVIPSTVSGMQRLQMIIAGFTRAWHLCRREAIHIVHCRSYRPAVMGVLLQHSLQRGFLFDMRGFLIDELIAASRWQAGSMKERVARLIEWWCIKNADALITTSRQFRDRVLVMFPRTDPARVWSIPNCVDTKRFQFDLSARDRLRHENNWRDRWVLMFAGDAERYQQTFSSILRFFNEARKQDPRSILVMLAYGDLHKLYKIIHESGFTTDDILAMDVPPADVPKFLSAADVGLAFFRVINFALSIASPIKVAEYLACGLPVVINPGIGDTARILHEYHTGIVLDPENDEMLPVGVTELINLTRDPNLRQRCRQAAEKELSLDMAVERYAQVYDTIAARVKSRRR